MMKKIISCIISLLCLSGIMNVSASSTATDENQNFRYVQMMDMGFISDKEEADYIVTRGEFAQIMSKAYNLGGTAANIHSYSDVPFDDEYYNSIQLVSEAGIMNGYDDGSFKPLDPVKVTEVIKVFVDSLGYKALASASGGYPFGYNAVADDVKLLRYTSVKAYDAPIKRRELGVMLYNLLTSNMNDVIAMTDGKVGYQESEETFAQKYHNLSFVSDVVTANSYTNFSEEIEQVSETQLVVGNELLTTNDFKSRFMVGRYVSVFYDEESYEISSMVERVEDEEIFSLMSYEVNQLNKNSIVYTEGSRNKTIKLEDEMVYIYNDKLVLSFDFTTLENERDYRITFVDNNDDTEYDVVFIENYYTVAVGDITSDWTAKSKIKKANASGKYESVAGVTIDDEGADTVYLCDSENNRISRENISSGDILTVVSNEGYARVILSRGSVNVKIGSVSDEGRGQKLIVAEDSEFYATEELDQYFEENDVLASEATIYLDVFGNAAFIVVKDASGEKYGLLISSVLSDEDGENSILFRIFTDEATEVKIKSADKIKINDNNYKPMTLSSLPSALSGVTDTPVLYKLSEDGKVKEISLPQSLLSGNSDGFFLGASVSSVLSSVTPKVYGGTVETGKDTVAFVMPDGTYNKETSTVYVGDAIPHDTVTSYTVDAYYKTKNNDVADIVVIRAPQIFKVNANSPVVVLTKVNGVEMYEDEICRKVEYLTNGNINTAYINESKYPVNNADTIGVGDTVQILVDTKGYLRDCTLIYDYDREKYTDSLGVVKPSNFTNSNGLGWGYVVRNSNGRIRVSTDKIEESDSSVFGLMMHVLANYDLMMVESEKEITKCTAADINAGDKVVYALRSGRGKAMVVYK